MLNLSSVTVYFHFVQSQATWDIATGVWIEKCSSLAWQCWDCVIQINSSLSSLILPILIQLWGRGQEVFQPHKTDQKWDNHVYKIKNVLKCKSRHLNNLFVHDWATCIFTVLTTSVDNKVVIIVILFYFCMTWYFRMQSSLYVFTIAGV